MTGRCGADGVRGPRRLGTGARQRRRAHGGQALQPLATGAGADRRPPRAVDAVRCPVGVLASLTAVSAFAGLDVTSVVSSPRPRSPDQPSRGLDPRCRPLLQALPPGVDARRSPSAAAQQVARAVSDGSASDWPVVNLPLLDAARSKATPRRISDPTARSARGGTPGSPCRSPGRWDACSRPPCRLARSCPRPPRPRRGSVGRPGA